MNEAKKQNADFEEDTKKYSLRGAQQVIARKEAAIQKRAAQITRLRAENKQDAQFIRKLQAHCDELRQAEIVRRVGQLCGSGNEMTTERLNKLLDFCELAGDALSAVSVEQLVDLIQGKIAQPSELAARAQEIYDENTGNAVKK